MKSNLISILLAMLLAAPAWAQTTETKPDQTDAVRKYLELLSRLKITGYLQAQYVHNDRSVDETTSPSSTRNLDQFSVRRGRIKFTYQAGKNSRFVLQPDLSSSGVTLKDAFAEFTEPWTSWRHTVTGGQFYWPFGFELTYSSTQREMPERSLVIRTLFPGERDRGVMVSGGPGNLFQYRVGLMNGTGTAQSFDYNKRKDLVGRIGSTAGPVQIGASVYRGSELVSLGGLTSGKGFDKQREGLDLQWTPPRTGLIVRGEYVRGVQPPAPGSAVATARAADVDGWILYAIQNLGSRHQVALRADQYDPDTELPGDATRTLGASYSFRWDGHNKVMLAYERPELERDDPDDDLLTVRYQFSF